MQPTSTDLIINCRWLIPIIPENQIMERQAIAIKGSRIVEILPIPEAAKKYSAKHIQHLEHHVVMPGLINSNAYAATRILRGHSVDIASSPIEQLLSDSDFVSASTELAIAEMIKSGTTCYSDQQNANNKLVESVRLTQIRSRLNFALDEKPSHFGSDASDYLHRGLKLRDYCSSYPLVEIACNLSNINQLTNTTLDRLAAYANELELPLNIQCNINSREIEQSIEQSDCTIIERLFNAGLLLSESKLTNVNRLSENDLALIEKSNCHLVISPQANLMYPNNMQTINRIINTENNVSLGTSSNAGNESYNLWPELKAATQAMTLNYPEKSQACIAHQALRLATINGAKTLGLDQEIGSLEPQKYADLIAIEINSLSDQPLYNLATQLVSSIGHHVTHSWVSGQKLLENSTLCSLDEHNLIQSAQDWGKKVLDIN